MHKKKSRYTKLFNTYTTVYLLLAGIVVVIAAGLMGYGDEIERLLQLSWMSNSVGQVSLAVILYIMVRLIVQLFNKRIVTHLQRLDQKKKKTDIYKVLYEYVIDIPKYFLVSLYTFLPLKVLNLPDLVDQIVNVIIIALVVLQAIRLVNDIFIYLITNAVSRKGESVDKTTKNAVQMGVQVVVWALGILLFLMNLGVEVSPLLASLGIWGIAVAFALQNVLQDIFASMSLFFDKPFKIGDFIIVGTDLGIVKDVTMKSTRIDTLQGQELTIPNREIMNSRINNYNRMQTRRVVSKFGVTYETPAHKLKMIPEAVKEIVEKTMGVQFDRCHFKEYGDFSLNFELVYYVLDADYNVFMDKQQSINFDIFDMFHERHIDFAYPTQLVYTHDKTPKVQTEMIDVKE